MMVHLSFASGLDLVSTALVSCLYKTYARSFIMIYPKCVYFSISFMFQWIWFPGPWFVFDSCLVKMSKAMVREVSQLMLVHYLFPTPCWGQRNQNFECNCGDLEEAWPGGTGWCQLADCCPESCHWTPINSIFWTITSDGYQIKFHFLLTCEAVRHPLQII